MYSSIMLDLAASTIADRQRSASTRLQRATLRRGRLSVRAARTARTR